MLLDVDAELRLHQPLQLPKIESNPFDWANSVLTSSEASSLESDFGGGGCCSGFAGASLAGRARMGAPSCRHCPSRARLQYTRA